MRSNDDDRFAAELSEARGIIDALRADGAGTRALELELSRARRAASEERWDEAERRIERVLAAGSRVPAPAPALPVPAERVEEKLASARRRIDVLKRLGLDVSGMEEAAARAEAFAASSYPASAESIVDELLVLTKAAAEGVRSLAHAGKPGAPPAAPSGDDFIGVLRTAVTEIADARGWMTEERARALLGEVLPKLFLLERHVAEQVHRCAADAAKDLATARAELAGGIAERAAALDASLRALREETVPAISRARDAVAAVDTRAAQALAAAEHAAGTGADAARRIAADVAEHARALAGLGEDLRALAQRCEGFAGAGDVDDLAAALAEARERLDSCASRDDVAKADAAIAGARAAIAAQEEAHRALAAATRADARTAAESLAQLSRRLGEALDEQGQVLVQIEASIDEQRRRVAALSGGADVAAVDALASGQAEARARLAALEQRVGAIDLDALRAAIADAGARLGQVESRPAGDVETLRTAVAEATARVAEVERRQANAAASGAAAVEDLEAKLRALGERHDATGRRLDAVSHDVETRAPDEVVGALAGGLDNLRTKLAALDERVGAVASASGDAVGLADAIAALKRADAERAAALEELARRIAERPAADASDALAEARRDAAAARERVEALTRDVARRPTTAALDELRRALVDELSRHPTDEALDELRRADVALQGRLDALARDGGSRVDAGEIAALRDRVEALALEVAARGDAAALTVLRDRVDALTRDTAARTDSAEVAALSDRVEALARDLASRGDAEALTAVQERLAALARDTALRADSADVAALRERLDTLAREVASRGDAAALTALQARTEALARDVAAAASGAGVADLRAAVDAAGKAAADADERRGSLAVQVATLARVVHGRAASDRVEAIDAEVGKLREALRALEARDAALAATLDERLRAAAAPSADEAAIRDRVAELERRFADDGEIARLSATVKGLRAASSVENAQEPTPAGGRSTADVRGIVDLLLREAQVAAKSVGELRDQVAALAQRPATAEPDARVDAVIARLDAAERAAAAAPAAVDALATRLGLLESRLDVIERRADERTLAILARIDELTAAAASGGAVPVAAGDLDERVARRVMERIAANPPPRADIASIRAALPELLAAPEVGRMIVNTLLVDALQGGGDSPLRKLLRTELDAIAPRRDVTTIEPRIAVETRVPFDIPSPPLAALDPRRDPAPPSAPAPAPARRSADVRLGSDAVAETGAVRNEVVIKPKTEAVVPAKREPIKIPAAVVPAKAEPAKAAPAKAEPHPVIEPFAPRKRP